MHGQREKLQDLHISILIARHHWYVSDCMIMHQELSPHIVSYRLYIWSALLCFDANVPNYIHLEKLSCICLNMHPTFDWERKKRQTFLSESRKRVYIWAWCLHACMNACTSIPYICMMHIWCAFSVSLHRRQQQHIKLCSCKTSCPWWRWRDA